MCKLTNSDTSGTSFHNDTFKASVQDIINAIGEPSYDGNTGEDKVNFEWELETDEGDVFCIYDWKEYRRVDINEKIEWHIGAKNASVSSDAEYEVMRELGNYVN